MSRVSDREAIAYFSMEIGIRPAIPTYSGGLGILAGDTIRSAADMNIPTVAVTLLYHKGYFRQKLDQTGWQTEEPVQWSAKDHLEDTGVGASIILEGRSVLIKAWKCEITGIHGFKVPIYLLDTDLPENSEPDKKVTDYLYGGDALYRMSQELVLGIGGVRILRALGYHQIYKFHMNEGHASFLVLELLKERMQWLKKSRPDAEDVEEVRKKCVFTTHTPVPAGHDQFPLDLVERVLEHRSILSSLKDFFPLEGALNMTHLALNLSHYVNGVAKRHGEVSKQMFPNYVIDSITNGVHTATWTSEPIQNLFDRYLPGWRGDNFVLRYGLNIPKREVWAAHEQNKRALLNQVKRASSGNSFDPNILTLGFARRATAYKRPTHLLSDFARLKNIAKRFGGLQVVYAGKAHPKDQSGKEAIQAIFKAREALKGIVSIAYLENYEIDLAKLITSGVDVWLNTPEPPLEASGTSGMKAALNGVPSLSVLDGWWIEGCIEGVTGWAIGGDEYRSPETKPRDASALYDKLETEVLPAYYRNRDKFIGMMLNAISLNGSFFNTQRMMNEYLTKAYYS